MLTNVPTLNNLAKESLRVVGESALQEEWEKSRLEVGAKAAEELNAPLEEVRALVQKTGNQKYIEAVSLVRSVWGKGKIDLVLDRETISSGERVEDILDLMEFGNQSNAPVGAFRRVFGA